MPLQRQPYDGSAIAPRCRVASRAPRLASVHRARVALPDMGRAMRCGRDRASRAAARAPRSTLRV